MNYDEQNQQFYNQRMPTQQQQRMSSLPTMAQQGQPNMQQQQAIRQPHYGMMHPQQQQIMVRMQPPMGEDQVGHYQQQYQIRDIIQNLPLNIQNQIKSETNPERRKQLLQAILSQQQMYDQQIQGGMGMRIPMNMPQQRLPMSQGTGGGMMIYPGGQGQMVVQQANPAQIQFARIPSQSSIGQSPGQIPQMYMVNPNQMAQQSRAGMQPMPVNQAYIQQQQQPQFTQQQSNQLAGAPTPQQQRQPTHKQPVNTLGNLVTQQQQQQLQKSMPNTPQLADAQTAGGGGIALAGHGPQQMRKTASSHYLQQHAGQPPSNEGHLTLTTDSESAGRTQNSLDQQPRSVGTPLSTNQPQNETENQEYKALFEKLRTYHSDVRRLLERLNLDNPGEMKLKSSLINVIQVMEGTRKGVSVNKELLRKLLSNVQTVLAQYSISRHLVLAAKKLNGMSTGTKEVIAKESLFADPWREVRHRQIRIPDEVLATIESGKGGQESREGALKVSKKTESAVDEPPTKRSLLAAMAESFSHTPQMATTTTGNLEKVKCMDGSELVLNPELSMALKKAVADGFSIDFDQLPISRSTSTLQVQLSLPLDEETGGAFGSGDRATPSLDLLLPVDYPKSAIQVLSNYSDEPYSPFVDILLDKIDAGEVSMLTLGGLLRAWSKCF